MEIPLGREEGRTGFSGPVVVCTMSAQDPKDRIVRYTVVSFTPADIGELELTVVLVQVGPEDTAALLVLDTVK